VASEDDDKVLIRNFLRGYAGSLGLSPPKKLTFPDKLEREIEAIDALATWDSGQSLAIEHTLIQPFPDEQYKLKGEIGRIFEPLCDDPAVPLAGYHIWLKVPLDGLAKGADRNGVARVVRTWFQTIRDLLPDGRSELPVSGLAFDLKLVVYKQFLGHEAKGAVSVTYFGERTEGELSGVIRKALDDKLCKLVKYKAQMRFLLFEMSVRSYVAWDVAKHLDLLKNDFPKLSNVDNVWVVDTSEVNRLGRFFCTDVWPVEVGKRFFACDWVDDNQ